MATLPEQLERLEEAVKSAGGTVHWARDGAEATAIVARIAQATGRARGDQGQVARHGRDRPQRGPRRASAIEAIETDLAELIIQLDRRQAVAHPRARDPQEPRRDQGAVRAHDRPGRRTSAGEAPAIAEAARTHLRDKFLIGAGGGIGRELRVAETGTICVVESEGNGRMCTTLPETLICVMGIEKVLPELARSRGLPAALPRSSTAERMNPYTSLWTGVREGDGPQEFHLVLLDNGRTACSPTRSGARRCTASAARRA